MKIFFDIYRFIIFTAAPVILMLPAAAGLICFFSNVILREKIDPSLEYEVKEARRAIGYIGYRVGKLKVGYGALSYDNAVAQIRLKHFRGGVITLCPEAKYITPMERITILIHEMAHICANDDKHGEKWVGMMKKIGEKCGIYEHPYIEKNGRLVRLHERVDYEKAYGIYD